MKRPGGAVDFRRKRAVRRNLPEADPRLFSTPIEKVWLVRCNACSGHPQAGPIDVVVPAVAGVPGCELVVEAADGAAYLQQPLYNLAVLGRSPEERILG